MTKGSTLCGRRCKLVHKAGQHIHFIGIGGVGMSGIAQLLLGLGHKVSGSDHKASQVTERLQALGAVCYTGHRTRQVEGADKVVVSSAIREDNEELRAARSRNIPVMRRGEMLAWLMAGKKGIAVAGTHGKTTTTAMISLLLARTGLDPTILVGGELDAIGGNAVLGRSEWLVAEADESDGSFLLLDPFVAVVTNIEDDHMEHYGSQEEITGAFVRFLSRIPPDGTAVLCTDDPGVRDVLPVYRGNRRTYGEHGSPDFLLRVTALSGLAAQGEISYRGRLLGTLRLGVPGRHNLLNACGAVAAGILAGVPFADAAAVLARFRGVRRRFEIVGEKCGVTVVDDYAHHPSEIKATLKAATQVGSGSGRIVACFQPHRFTRTKRLAGEFAGAFDDADLVIVSDVYSAGEKPLDGVSGLSIMDAFRGRNGRVVMYRPTIPEVVDYLAGEVRPGDLVLTLGAGDIYRAGRELLTRLQDGE